jgi:hypothetical protein
MELECSLLCLQEPVIGLSSQPDASSLHIPAQFP